MRRDDVPSITVVLWPTYVDSTFCLQGVVPLRQVFGCRGIVKSSLDRGAIELGRVRGFGEVGGFRLRDRHKFYPASDHMTVA